MTSIALDNYIRRRSHDDVTFVEFNCNFNFIPSKILPDVIAHSRSHGTSRPSCMDFILNEIINNIIEQ